MHLVLFMPIAVVTGANRGIGAEWVNQLLEKGWTVYAGYRKNLDKLEHVSESNLFIHQLDVQSNQSVVNFCNQVEGPIDLLVNNAGVGDGRWQKLEDIDDKWSLDVLDINAIGPVRMVQALYGKMSHDKLTKVAMISSLMGSIDDCKSGRSYAYRASKSALNMFTMAMKNEAKENNITFAILHPGWVKTDMGGSLAPVTMSESVDGMMKVLESQTLENSGRFIQFDGEKLPW
ncbi:MAG: SDR family oxidoreductase [Euryarchaeota archaeon]|nr:SDR family oxidoreductase [Euryarchaeota archaeon]